jgi:hypothetical protein
MFVIRIAVFRILPGSYREKTGTATEAYTLTYTYRDDRRAQFSCTSFSRQHTDTRLLDRRQENRRSIPGRDKHLYGAYPTSYAMDIGVHYPVNTAAGTRR